MADDTTQPAAHERSAPRIAIYGAGNYGFAVTRMAHANGWPIVAAYNRAGSKVGQDIGRLAGLDVDLGVLVEECDTADYGDLDADIAIVATTDRLRDNMIAFERLLTTGVNVLSHNTESYLPWAVDRVLATQLDGWAHGAGVTFTGGGIWDASRIWSGILATGPCTSLSSLHHTSRTNLGVSKRVSPVAGIGFSHDRFQAELIDQPGMIGELYKLIPWHVVQALGYEVTNVVERREPVLFDTTVHAAGLGRDIPAGEPAGLRVLVDVSTAQGLTAHAHIELRVCADDEADFMRWDVRGEPNSTVHVDRQVGPPGSATSLINRVRDVIAAPPGIQEISKLGPPKHSALEGINR